MTDIDIKSSLEVWGCTDVEIINDEIWFVNDEGLEAKLPKDEFTLDSDCLVNATYYSCCGEVLDMDIRVCFKCLEHC